MAYSARSKIFILAATLVLIGGLSGCGSSNSSSPASVPVPGVEVRTGVLVDDAVSGVTYTTATQDGVTNGDGEFQYMEGETVTFTIGNIELGSVPGAAIVTPVELTGSDSPTDAAALNQLVFLQSVDDNGNPADGIVINDAVQNLAAVVTLDFASPAFSTDVASVVTQITGGANKVVSEEDALGNFFETYEELGGSETLGFDFPDPGGTIGGGFAKLTFVPLKNLED